MHSIDYIKAMNAEAAKKRAPAAVRPSTAEAHGCLANALFTMNDAFVGRHVVIIAGMHYGKTAEITGVTLIARDQDDIMMAFDLKMPHLDTPLFLQNKVECVVLKGAL